MNTRYFTNIGHVGNEEDKCVSRNTNSLSFGTNIVSRGTNTLDIDASDHHKPSFLKDEPASVKNETTMVLAKESESPLINIGIKDNEAEGRLDGHGQPHHFCKGHGGKAVHRGNIATRTIRLEDSEETILNKLKQAEDHITGLSVQLL